MEEVGRKGGRIGDERKTHAFFPMEKRENTLIQRSQISHVLPPSSVSPSPPSSPLTSRPACSTPGLSTRRCTRGHSSTTPGSSARDGQASGRPGGRGRCVPGLRRARLQRWWVLSLGSGAGGPRGGEGCETDALLFHHGEGKAGAPSMKVKANYAVFSSPPSCNPPHHPIDLPRPSLGPDSLPSAARCTDACLHAFLFHALLLLLPPLLRPCYCLWCCPPRTTAPRAWWHG